jgi:hypothetical protein
VSSALVLTKDSLALIGGSLGVLILSLIMVPLYVNGDQATYIETYNLMARHGLVEGFLEYSARYGYTPEFVHFLVVWTGSHVGLDKAVLMSLANCMLAYYMMRLLISWNVSFAIALIVVLTNFYMYGLYFAGERLKFGFLFFAVSLVYIGKRNIFFTTASLSVFGHVQMLILYGVVAFKDFTQDVFRSFQTLRFPRNQVYILLLVCLLVGYLGGYLYWKILSHAALHTGNYLYDLVRISVFLLLALWYSDKRVDTFLIFIPIILSVLVLGPDRTNMIGYVVFMYFGLRFRRGVNLGVLITCVYYASKSFAFILEVIATGRAYSPDFSVFT